MHGAKLGSGGVRYDLWAPMASTIEIEITPTGGAPQWVKLDSAAGGFFTGLDAGGRAGDLYRFRVDDEIEWLPDPASRWQPRGVHGPSMVIDPTSYVWQTHVTFQRPAFRDLVIYEFHLGCFTAEGTFLSAIAKLDHLKALGVTALELMPVADFSGGRNWGYDGVCLYAPARCYGHPDHLRALVDAAHARGMAVILDVVFNHFGPEGNYLSHFIGDYLDETQKTPWGGAIRYGTPGFEGLRSFALGNIASWMEDFRIDGFRLDATHAIHDDSADHLLANLTDAIRHRGGWSIAEDERNEAALLLPTQSSGLGIDGVWADDFHHAVHVALTGERHAYFAAYEGTIHEVARALNDGWLYCGQISPWTGAPRGTSPEGLAPAQFIHCLTNHDQAGNRALGERLAHIVPRDALRAASALLCLSPHTPMLFMGQEWAASTPFLFFTDHGAELAPKITAGRREEFRHFPAYQDEKALHTIPDPQADSTFLASKLRWEETATTGHADVLSLFRACLALRKQHAAFRPVDKTAFGAEEILPGLLAVTYRGCEETWLMLTALKGGIEGTLPHRISEHRWQLLLSTNERRFGGDGNYGLDEPCIWAHFDKPETIVLKRVPTGQ